MRASWRSVRTDIPNRSITSLVTCGKAHELEEFVLGPLGHSRLCGFVPG